MKRIFLCALLAGIIVIFLTGCVTIVKIGEEASLTGKVSFTESLDVSAFWDSQAVAEVQEKAVELSDFLTQNNGDIAKTAKEYGRYTMGTSGELNVAVRGEATVKQVFSAKKAGYLLIQPDGYEGPVAVKIQIGTVFKGTTIRDYLSFLDINDYGDQIKFAQLSKKINQYIQEHVVDPIEVQTLENQRISFWGCFTYTSSDELLITPVVLMTNEGAKG